MGGGSTTTNENQSSQSINEIPQWVQNAGQANYGLAQQVASQPLQQYQGQLVADTAPQTQQAWNLAANSGNVGLGSQNAAQAGYLNTLASTPQQNIAYHINPATPTVAAQAAPSQNVTAAQAQAAPTVTAQQAALSTLGGMNLSQYMNPYTKDVINQTLPIMNQSLAQQQNALANQANAANAFGGSRQGIQAGVTGAQGALAEGQLASQLWNQNFQQAQAAGEFDVGQANAQAQFNAGQMNQVGTYNENQLNQIAMANAQQANQVGMANQQQANQVGLYNANMANQVGMNNQNWANQIAQSNQAANDTINYQNQMALLQQEQLNNAASMGLGNLGLQQMQNNIGNFGMLTSAGGMEQQQAQNDINAQIANYQQAWQYPQQQLGIMESALGMTPYNTGTSGSSASTSTTMQNNPGAMALGGLETLGNLFSAPAGGTSAAAGLFGMLSDRRMKTDIKRVGKHPAGVGIYSYRYKGDPKSYPKVVGPMAEDVAKIAPHAVSEIPGSGGKRMINMGALNTPPSSPGVATAIGMLKSGPTPRGGLMAGATPPTRGILGRGQKRVPGAPIIGALGG